MPPEAVFIVNGKAVMSGDPDAVIPWLLACAASRSWDRCIAYYDLEL